MKNNVFSFLLVLFFTPVVHAQMVNESQVPEAVRVVAIEQNKGKKISMWTMDKVKGNYVASFIDPTDMRMIYISPEGKWLDTRNGIRPESMPEPVLTAAKAAAKEKFGRRYELFNYFYVTGPEEAPYYMLNASPKNDTKFIALFFDPTGKALSKP
jgi:hypothetical protein